MPANADSITSTRARVQTWALAAALAAPVLFFAKRAWAMRWMSDDGFINLRVVRNLLDGHGPVFNVGERVEAYTSSLWVLFVALLGALGLRLEPVAVYAGLLLAVAGLALAICGALAAHGVSLRDPGVLARRRVLPLGAAVFAALPPAWDHATAGLETGLSLFWLGASFALMVALVVRIEAGERASLAALTGRACWLGLGPLVRPELALVSLGFLLLLVAHLVSERERWVLRVAVLGLAAGLVPVAHQVFRMGYFAALTPNTALAKEAFESRWDQGGYFFDNFFGLYGLLMPLAVVGLLLVGPLEARLRAGAWRRAAVLLVPLVGGVAYCVYVVKVGGGFMHGRLFLPGVFCLLMPMAALPLGREASAPTAGWQRVAVLLVVLWCVVCAKWIRVAEANEHGIGDERGWYGREAKVDNPVRVGDYAALHFYKDAHFLLDRAAERCQGGRDAVRAGDAAACERFVFVDTVAYGRLDPHETHLELDPQRVGERVVMVVQRVAIGVAGFVLGPSVHLVDHVGLADPLAARMALAERGRPGHEKALSNYWFVARFAAPGAAAADPRVAAARRALSCGELAELMDAVRAPMTFERFVSNLGRSFRLQSLRIPVDPHEAERVFCGPP